MRSAPAPGRSRPLYTRPEIFLGRDMVFIPFLFQKLNCLELLFYSGKQGFGTNNFALVEEQEKSIIMGLNESVRTMVSFVGRQKILQLYVHL